MSKGRRGSKKRGSSLRDPVRTERRVRLQAISDTADEEGLDEQLAGGEAASGRR